MLIRSGEAPGIGWSRNMLYSGFNTLPRSVIRRQTGFAARITRTLSGLDHGLHIEMLEPNPYLSPSSEQMSATRIARAECPVCRGSLSRIRLIFPFARCGTCNRRIRLRNSALASSLSTITAIGCFISLLLFEATPEKNAGIFCAHVVAFVLLGTLWFHLFGKPSLAWWLWHASPATLNRERQKFRDESNRISG